MDEVDGIKISFLRKNKEFLLLAVIEKLNRFKRDDFFFLLPQRLLRSRHLQYTWKKNHAIFYIDPSRSKYFGARNNYCKTYTHSFEQ